MASTLSWIDHDAAASERSMRLLSMFQERESRDELGIGGIRDAIADQLFPGTSTIQTRLRYVFFIPWAFSDLDARSISGSDFPSAAREAESRLLAALVKNELPTTYGVIGREAGSTLKRMPSSVYWAALGSWGLRGFDGSLQQYFAQADTRRAIRKARRSREDGEDHDGDASGRAWHAQAIALRPPSFPADASLSLTRIEAEFLLDRWRHAHPRSLLTWLALDLTKRKEVPEASRIWEHPQFANFPAETRNLIDHARRFDLLIRGAALLYNLQLSELDGREELASDYGTELEDWAAQSVQQCQAWNLGDFWPKVIGQGHTITGETKLFVEQWWALATNASAGVAQSTAARRLIELRERRLKQARSRFANCAALSQWGGRAGLEPLKFRWPTASTFLQDWHAGWRRR